MHLHRCILFFGQIGCYSFYFTESILNHLISNYIKRFLIIPINISTAAHRAKRGINVPETDHCCNICSCHCNRNHRVYSSLT